MGSANVKYTRRGWTGVNAGTRGLALLAATLAAVGAMLAAATAALAVSPPVNTVAPTISGSTVPGHTLTANHGTWTGSPTPTYAYQWQLCAASCSNIAGATSATYSTPLTYANAERKFAVKVTATNSAGVASATSAQSAAIPEPPAPTVTLSGRTVTWSAIPGVTQYVVADVRHPETARETSYFNVTGTSYTPSLEFPGEHVDYGIRAFTRSNDPDPPWGANEATLNWPIVGINAGAGWGSDAADTILDGHVNWDRVEVGAGSVADSVDDGFNVLGVVGNTDDGTPLSSINATTWGATVVDQLEDNPGISIAEAGNEMYFKGGVADPVKYGQMYLAAVTAMATAGIHTKLLFNMWGDFYCGDSSFISCPSNGWSQDSGGRGWLADAVAGVPGLAAAIEANGVSTHPYGAVGTNGADEEGTGAVAG
ncbi:MAG TPA: hypothetical protein VGM33_24385, partial [Baekduia sp.]